MKNKKFSKGLDNRMRDKDGEIREKRSNTLLKGLRKEYGENFYQEYRADMMLGTLKNKEGVNSLSQLIKKKDKK
jgi:hypothetical protein